ncbi:helix-turn-helix domain-containing protein [Actinoplanes sp. CA-054009]
MAGPSPYVRRRSLAKEIRRLRGEHGCNAADLARAVGFTPQHLSAIENARIRPDLDLVSGICDYLQVGSNRRDDIITAATDGWARGWWESQADQIGTRQALYADLESGTAAIAEYAFSLIPGLLQTAEFADARIRSDPGRQSEQVDPVMAVAARAHRQQMLLAAEGPRYDVVIDEFAVRRCAADRHIVGKQLRHIVDLCRAHGSVTVRILPVSAVIKGHSAPRSAHSIYKYRDRHATLAVAVDTLTTDLVFTEVTEIDAYKHLHSRLKAASLSPEESVRMLDSIAEQPSSTEGVAA